VGISKLNETLKKNQEKLAQLINATCFLAKQELFFHGHE
jgi:hypothetical protein